MIRRIAVVLLCLACQPALASDVVAARKLAKENNCFRCHAIEREKDGPSWSSIGDKYRKKSDGEAKLIEHLTSAPKIKLREQDIEEEHYVIKYQDKAQLENLVRWILSL